MTVKSYNKIVFWIKKVVKTVGEKTMDDANKKMRDSAASTEDIVNTSVLGDGTWQRKGSSSFNGVFEAISIESGEVLDVEPKSRYCKGCKLKKDLKVKTQLHMLHAKMHIYADTTMKVLQEVWRLKVWNAYLSIQ